MNKKVKITFCAQKGKMPFGVQMKNECQGFLYWCCWFRYEEPVDPPLPGQGHRQSHG